MKSAKELFEELGYKLILQDNHDIRYLREDTYTDEINIYVEEHIIFCINDGIGLYPNNSIILERLEKNDLSDKWYNTEFVVTTELLQAINQQVNELGWNDTTLNLDVKLDGKKVMEAMRRWK